MPALKYSMFCWLTDFVAHARSIYDTNDKAFTSKPQHAETNREVEIGPKMTLCQETVL